MPLTLDNNEAMYQIRAYQPGFIKVNSDVFTHSLIISADKLIQDWAPQRISELTREHLLTVINMHPAVLIIGTGEELQFPDIELYGDLINEGIGVEIMDTRAACHTYNVLTAEKRNVIAALIIK